MSGDASAIPVPQSKPHKGRIAVILIVIVVLAIIMAAGAWGLRGQGLRVAAMAKVNTVFDTIKAVKDSHSISARGDFSNVIFLHHSTGHNLIHQGQVRERLTEAGYEFWDHDYNRPGLTRPDGTSAGYSYSIPNDNTDPDGLARIFSQHPYSWPRNAFSGLMQHEVIVFKSCFPVSDITSQAKLEQYKRYYLDIRDVVDQHPDRIFIVLSPPPLVPEHTTPEIAARARAFANWLKSDEYLDGHANLLTFDFFELLAGDDASAPDYNMLRSEYRRGHEGDSHPNPLANETIGPQFAEFIDNAVQSYRASGE
jgi:hypothetical protein